MRTSDRWHESYERFLRSPEWFAARAVVLKRDGYRCYCGRIATQVHHTAYIRGQWTNPAFLRSICRPCHEAIHSRRRIAPQKPRSALLRLLRWLFG